MNDTQQLIWQARNALADALLQDGVSHELRTLIETAMKAAREAGGRAWLDTHTTTTPPDADLLPVARTDWQGYPCYASARHLLNEGYSCRSPERGGWAIYVNECGGYTLYPGGEGPQEAQNLEEVLGWIGGDQVAALTPGARGKLRENGARA